MWSVMSSVDGDNAIFFSYTTFHASTKNITFSIGFSQRNVSIIELRGIATFDDRAFGDIFVPAVAAMKS